jgi:hypothetical protein
MGFLRIAVKGTQIHANTMSKKTNLTFLLLSAVACILAFLFWLREPHNNSSETSQAQNQQLIKVRAKNEEKVFLPSMSLNDEEAKVFKQLLSKVLDDNRKHPVEYPSVVSYSCKVVDQHGNAVPEAKYWVNYHNGRDDKQISHGGFNMKADQNGSFEFTIDDRVSSATVAVSKLGYQPIEGKSLRYLIQKPSEKNNFANSKALTKEELKTFSELLPKSGLGARDESSEDEEVKVFVLHKMSDYDKMYQNMFTYSVNSRDVDERIPGKYMMEYKNYNANGVVPDDAHVIKIGPCFYDKSKEIQLQIKYRSNQVVQRLAAPWYCDMSIPGGGFFLIDEKLEPDGDVFQSRYSVDAAEGEKFLAPESGYEETVRAEMAESRMNETWRTSYTRNYYVKFPDGTYGRIKVNIGLGYYHDHFLV